MMIFSSARSSLANKKVLEGTWTSDCTPFGRHAVIVRVYFFGTNYRVVGKLYEQEGCKVNTVQADLSGTFYELPGLRDFDHTPKYLTLTLKSEEVVNHYNKYKICDSENWRLDYFKDVTGKKNCAGFEAPKAHVTLYDIFQINAAGRLQFSLFPFAWVDQPGERPEEIPQEALTLRRIN